MQSKNRTDARTHVTMVLVLLVHQRQSLDVDVELTVRQLNAKISQKRVLHARRDAIRNYNVKDTSVSMNVAILLNMFVSRFVAANCSVEFMCVR